MKNSKKKTLKSTRGITLIALVVTILLILILAGISISMLSRDNSILLKATDAKTNTERTSIVEQARTDVLGQIAENKGEKISKKQLKTILNKYFENIDTLEIPDDLSNSDIKLNANQAYGEYKDIALSEIYNGEFSLLAIDKLVINLSASKDEDKSPYVNYPSSKGTILCRVLYNDSSYGLQIIPKNYVTTLKLGKYDENINVTGSTDIEKAKNSYMRAITTLNEKAEEYIDEQGIAIGARCIGSNPILKNKNMPDILTDELRNEKMYTAPSSIQWMTKWNGKYWNTDNNYITDRDRLNLINLINPDNYVDYYWVASRYVKVGNGRNEFKVIQLTTRGNSFTGNNDSSKLFGLSNSGEGAQISPKPSAAFYPVFCLNLNTKILGGDGTINSPYEIGI